MIGHNPYQQWIVTDGNDVESTLGKLGIRLRDSETQWRSMEDVLDDVGARWSSLNDIEKSAVTVALAGTRQRDKLIAAFNNYDKVLEATVVSQTSAGTATEKYEHVMDSIEARINQLISTWEKMVNNFNQGDTFKSVIDTGTALIKVLDFIINKTPAVQIVLGVTLVAALKLLSKHLITATKYFTDISVAMSAVSVGKSTRSWTVAADAIAGLTESQKLLAVSMMKVSELDAKVILTRAGLNEEVIQAALANGALSVSNTTTALTTEGLSLAFKGLATSIWASVKAIAAFLVTNPVGWAILAAGAITATVFAIDAFTVSIDEQREKIEELQKEYEDVSSQLQSLQGELKTTQDRIEELNSKVKPLTLVEKEELSDLEYQNKLLEERIKLLEAEERIKQDALLSAQAELINKEQVVPYGEGAVQERLDNLYSNFDPTSGFAKDEKATLTQIIAEYDALKRKIEEVNTDTALSEEERTNELSRYQEMLRESSSRLTEIALDERSLLSILEERKRKNQELNDQEKALYDDLQKRVSAITSRTLGEQDAKKVQLDSLISSGSLDEVVSKIDSLTSDFNAGKLSANDYNTAIEDIFNTIASDKSVLDDLGISKIFDEDDLKDAESFKQALKEAFNISEVVESSKDEVETLDSIMNNIKDTVVDGEDAFKQFNETIANLESEIASGNVAWDDLSAIIDMASGAIGTVDSNMAIFEATLEKVHNSLLSDIKSMETLEGSYDSLSDGVRLSGTALEDFMNEVKTMGTVIDTETGNATTAYEILTRYIAETGDTTFDNGEIIKEVYELYKTSAENKVELEKGVAKEAKTSSTKFMEYAKKMLEVAISVVQGFNSMTGGLLGGLVEPFENMLNNLLGSVNKKIAEVEANFEGIGDEIKKDENLIAAFGTTGANAAKKVADATRDLLNSLKSSQSAISSLLDATMNMIKQSYSNRKDRLQDDLDDLKESYDAEKDYLDKLKKEKDKQYKKEKKEIDALKKAENERYKQRKKDLEDEYKKIEDNYKQQQEALEDELDAYKEKIKFELDLLRLKEEERKYDKDVEDKRNEISDIQSQLDAMEFDTSIEAQKKKLELAQQLADKEEELDEIQHDRDITLQEQALNDELERFEKLQNEKIEALEKESEQQKQNYEDRLAQLESEHETYLNGLDSRLESLEAEKDRWDENHQARVEAMESEYEYDRKRLERQIQNIEDYTSKESNIRKEAIKKMEGMSQEFFNQLMLWNKEYGTGVNDDVINMWNLAYGALRQFAGPDGAINVQNSLETISSKMHELENKTQNVASAFQEAARYIQKAAMELSLYNAMDFDAYDKKHSASSSFFPAPPKRSHNGEDRVSKVESPLDAMLGLKANETLRTLEVGERVISAKDNIGSGGAYLDNKTSDNVSRMVRSTDISNEGAKSLTITVGDFKIEGDATQDVVNRLEKARASIIQGVFDKIDGHFNRSGFKNIKPFYI